MRDKTQKRELSVRKGEKLQNTGEGRRSPAEGHGGEEAPAWMSMHQ